MSQIKREHRNMRDALIRKMVLNGNTPVEIRAALKKFDKKEK